MTKLDKSLADLAERIREANTAGRIAEQTLAKGALVAGELFCHAKDDYEQGAGTLFLGRTGIHVRRDRHPIQLVRSGLNPIAVSDWGDPSRHGNRMTAKTGPQGRHDKGGELLECAYQLRRTGQRRGTQCRS